MRLHWVWKYLTQPPELGKWKHWSTERPDFAFVYFGTVDVVGHAHRYMSDAYLRQVERTDASLGVLLSALLPGSHVVVPSDHGGHDWDHDTDLPEDTMVPWIAAGPGIRSGYSIARPVSHLDTAPTLARQLGIPAAATWTGNAVDEIFVD